jgi:hypothetical protein
MGNPFGVKVKPVVIEPDFDGRYPPTRHGIYWAVRQWAPLYTDGREGPIPLRIFHDAHVEEGIRDGHPHVWITGLIWTESLERLQDCGLCEEEFKNAESLAEMLGRYLDEFRPLGVPFEVRVLVVSRAAGEVVSRGPYR